jgi:hypothetical protein
MHLMVLLGDKAQLEGCFSPFGDIANLDVGPMESCFGPFGDGVNVSAR